MHMLGAALTLSGDIKEARRHIFHAIRHFQDAGDAAGLTMTLDDMSAVAIAEGDLPRAARLRGAARNLSAETGANLASVVEDAFDKGLRRGVRAAMSREDVERYGAEGAAMTLDDAVAYALEGMQLEDVGCRRCPLSRGLLSRSRGRHCPSCSSTTTLRQGRSRIPPR